MANYSSLPKGFQLLIATHKCVFSLSQNDLVKVFRSATDGGILAARQSGDGNGNLAIADSQLVILQNVRPGKSREYKLKGAHGDLRLLEFSSDSRTLFFTSTLSTAVQAYSIAQSRSIEPAQIHPSPPAVIAISKTSTLLLVASHSPPTISIQDLSTQNTPLDFKPPASETRAVCASFHPTCSTTFLLGFADGTLAVNRLPKAADWTAPRLPSELGRYERLHKPSMGGIVAADFVPGYDARTVSVGRDGKCRLVNFDGGVANLLRTWHISGPATCLSVLPWPKLSVVPDLVRGKTSSTIDNTLPRVLVAIGKADGKVLIFNTIGLLEQEVKIGTSVFSLQWVEGKNSL